MHSHISVGWKSRVAQLRTSQAESKASWGHIPLGGSGEEEHASTFIKVVSRTEVLASWLALSEDCSQVPEATHDPQLVAPSLHL